MIFSSDVKEIAGQEGYDRRHQNASENLPDVVFAKIQARPRQGN